ITAADDSPPRLQAWNCQFVFTLVAPLKPPTTWNTAPITAPAVLSTPPTAPSIGAACDQLLVAGSNTWVCAIGRPPTTNALPASTPTAGSVAVNGISGAVRQVSVAGL